MSIERVTQLPQLPERPDDAHKGSFGRVLIVAGSRGMSGAAALAGLGALRGGAGLVYLAVPAGILPIVAALEPSYLTIPLPEDHHGRLAAEARPDLSDIIESHDAIACGPGLGRSAELVPLVAWLYDDVAKPMVIDADGLNALSEVPAGFPKAAGPRVLTPHPGEFARLIEGDIRTVQQNRESLATRFAGEHNCVMLLKGAGTVITDGRRIAINETGNSGMATGGTGDVLTGLITALLGQGMDAFEAAQLGAHLHGLAGDLAAADLSEPGLIASDLPKYLPRAWQTVRD